MASSRGQGGIQQLLAAEQEAQRIVNAAKNGIVAILYYFHLNFFLFICQPIIDSFIMYIHLKSLTMPFYLQSFFLRFIVFALVFSLSRGKMSSWLNEFACVFTPPPLLLFLIVTPIIYVKSLYLYTNHYSGSLLLEKSARLKQAKEEAEKEIAEYRAQLEFEFQRKVSEVSV